MKLCFVKSIDQQSGVLGRRGDQNRKSEHNMTKAGRAIEAPITMEVHMSNIKQECALSHPQPSYTRCTIKKTRGRERREKRKKWKRKIQSQTAPSQTHLPHRCSSFPLLARQPGANPGRLAVLDGRERRQGLLALFVSLLYLHLAGGKLRQAIVGQRGLQDGSLGRQRQHLLEGSVRYLELPTPQAQYSPLV